jgi:DNA-directed RNA polymerase alpha subunit
MNNPQKVQRSTPSKPTLIENMNLTVRAYNSLKRYGIHTTTELKTWCRCDLMDMRNIGIVTVQEIIDALKAYNGDDIKPCNHGKNG